MKFLGHILSQDGVRSDPDKVAAVVNMEEPMSVKELRCFLGMVNQLSKFMPHLAEMTKLLRDLLSNKNQLMWGQAQKLAFSPIKDALTKSPALALYDPEFETTVSADTRRTALVLFCFKHKPMEKGDQSLMCLDQ